VVEIVLQDADIGRVVSVYDNQSKVNRQNQLYTPTPDTRSSMSSGRVSGFVQDELIL
jgi:hypothetical protein